MSQVRIIGGLWRRRQLHFPDGEGLRPTPDRVRETLFNWLGQDLTGQVCLDLFAGSGALGFEAASRGAEKVVLVDHAGKAAHTLHKHIEMLGASGRLEVMPMDALKYLSFHKESGQKRFDVVFLDPPYRQDWLPRLEPWLSGLLEPDAALYVEAEFPVAALGDWKAARQGKAGQVYFHLLHRESLT
ncbi:MAG: 16S rRNA (guanine(966)-N(2))-methyltransferase RsmD [Zoogloeaceae bacterium]|jgi:16S rRNA (guanine966-N2)-methyltransferase|nr:16S rRNA (guanine(966)-N(2))-methyltransferase RsmD [Zoogloeaceae bacterium]